MIIGVSGKIGSGKDTIGLIIQYLVSKSHVENGSLRHLDMEPNDVLAWKVNDFINVSTWQIKKFAGKLKECVSVITGISVADLEKTDVKNKTLGEEWIRYGRAQGFFIDGSTRIMNNVACTKEEYERELKENWQTAYKLEHTPRTILQMLGTEVGRFIHPDTWVNALMVDYKPNKNAVTVKNSI